MVSAGEETELLVGVKNDGNSIKLDTCRCIQRCSFMLSSFLTVLLVSCRCLVIMPLFHVTLFL